MADSPRDRRRPIHTSMAAPMNTRAGVSTLGPDGLRIDEQTATTGSVPGIGFSAREIVVFFVATCVLSWSMGSILLVADGAVEYLMLLLGAAVPFIVAAAMTWRSEGTIRPLWNQITRWRVGWRWYAVAVGVPILLFGVALLILAILGGPGFADDAPPWWSALIILPLSVFLIGGPEEPGWRGYVLPRLQTRFNALVATLLLGAMWALWHAPLFVLPVEVYAGLNYGLYAILTIALSVVYTSIYNSSGGSVLLAMLLHGVINLALLWYPTTERLMSQLVLTAGALVVAALIILIYGPTNLSHAARVRSAPRLNQDWVTT